MTKLPVIVIAPRPKFSPSVNKVPRIKRRHPPRPIDVGRRSTNFEGAAACGNANRRRRPRRTDRGSGALVDGRDRIARDRASAGVGGRGEGHGDAADVGRDRRDGRGVGGLQKVKAAVDVAALGRSHTSLLKSRNFLIAHYDLEVACRASSRTDGTIFLKIDRGVPVDDNERGIRRHAHGAHDLGRRAADVVFAV